MEGFDLEKEVFLADHRVLEAANMCWNSAPRGWEKFDAIVRNKCAGMGIVPAWRFSVELWDYYVETRRSYL